MGLKKKINGKLDCLLLRVNWCWMTQEWYFSVSKFDLLILLINFEFFKLCVHKRSNWKPHIFHRHIPIWVINATQGWWCSRHIDSMACNDMCMHGWLHAYGYLTLCCIRKTSNKAAHITNKWHFFKLGELRVAYNYCTHKDRCINHSPRMLYICHFHWQRYSM